eukprot:GEMP01036267.1.p1 GENE.GEMP01036267.1~~GEMP01036267.1.p1  ORF type:complete len:436 (+),score=85.66 GEMP01036267.1:32-1339(+)
MKLCPEVGFCVRTPVTGSRANGRLFVNVCTHRLCGFPQTYSGQNATKDYILARGLSQLMIPVDCGSFRRLKARGDGCRQNAYCIDVILHPFLVQLFKDDEFCKSMSTYRQHFVNIAFNHVEKELGVRLEKDPKLVKETWYTDPDEDGRPWELTDINPEDNTSAPPPSQPQKEDKKEPLIEEIHTVKESGKKTTVMKKGFLQGADFAPLYPDGSNEGVLPENAGDPMGWMPKKLRQTCKIIDTSTPEYKAMEAQNAGQAPKNALASQLTSDFDRLAKKKMDAERWAEDNPCAKYSMNYSRFDAISDSDNENDRRPEAASVAPEAKSEPFDTKGMEEAMGAFECFEKGFLNKNAESQPKKAPIYTLSTNDELVTLKVDVPGLKSMRDVDLDVTSSICSLQFPSEFGPLECPWRVDVSTVKAKFCKKSEVLTITAACG